MRRITLCLPYYENPGMLTAQIEQIRAYSEDQRAHMRLFVVDDGSPKHPAALPADLPCETRLYRMREDIRWNQDACRNLMAAEAGGPDEWLLMTDIDHLVPPETMRECQIGKLRADVAYTFARISAPDFAPYKPHPNSYLLTVRLYDLIGGYDERFAGLYGTDGMFRSRAIKRSRGVIQLKAALIRVPRAVIADASTTSYFRKTSADDEGRAKVKADIARSGNHQPVRGRFAWDRIA